jgi:hypothetical protein
MSWRRWKLGVLVSIVLSLIVAGAGVAAGIHWQAFVSVLCAALLTHFGSFLQQNPVEKIDFNDTAMITRASVAATDQIKTDQKT